MLCILWPFQTNDELWRRKTLQRSTIKVYLHSKGHIFRSCMPGLSDIPMNNIMNPGLHVVKKKLLDKRFTKYSSKYSPSQTVWHSCRRLPDIKLPCPTAVTERTLENLRWIEFLHLCLDHLIHLVLPDSISAKLLRATVMSSFLNFCFAPANFQTK